MAVSMRLIRFGGKKSPYYRIVVSDRHSARDGRFIDQVGTYNPRKDPPEVRFKEEKAAEWLRKGAQPLLRSINSWYGQALERSRPKELKGSLRSPSGCFRMWRRGYEHEGSNRVYCKGIG